MKVGASVRDMDARSPYTRSVRDPGDIMVWVGAAPDAIVADQADKRTDKQAGASIRSGACRLQTCGYCKRDWCFVEVFETCT